MSDFRLEGDVDLNAADAASDLERQIINALAKALNSPAVQKLAVNLAKIITKELGKVSKEWDKTLKTMTSASEKAARSMGKAFAGVASEAAKATRAPTSNASLRTLEASIAGLTSNIEFLQSATRQQIRLTEALLRAEQAATRARSQEARTTALEITQTQREAIAASQERAALARAAARVEAAEITANARLASNRARFIQLAFANTWRSTERAVRAFARGASATISAFARGASRLISGIQRTTAATFRAIGRTIELTFRGAIRAVQAFARGITTAFRGVTTAISGVMRGMSRIIQAGLRRDEQAFNSSFRRRESAMRASNSRMASANAGLLGGLGGFGAAAGGAFGVGALLTSGFERAGLRERLQLQFQALLGGDAARATEVLQQLSDYARITAFEFDEVALSTAQLTAAFEGNVERGIELTQFLADVTALTGGTTSQLSAARLAFSQIAAAGRLEGQELNQLLESLPGAPLVRILADRFFGGDVGAFQKARRDGALGGKITAEGFFEAFQEGMAERFPEFEGFAVKASETLTGRMANLKESFAEFGASLIGLVDGPIKTFFSSITSGMDAVAGFITGSIFDPTSPERQAGLNPFSAAAEQEGRTGRIVEIPVGELPQEAQDALAAIGFEGPFVSATDAAAFWSRYAPPPEVQDNFLGLSDENLARLETFRELLADFVKGAGIVTALAGAFKLLALSFRLLTAPLSLLIIGAGSLAVFFGQIYRASEPLRQSVSALRESFGPLFDALAGIGGTLVDKFFGLFGEDNQTGMERIGGFLSGIVDSLTRGVGYLTEWITWADTMLEAGDIGAIFSSINTHLANFIGGLIGISESEIAAEGGGIAGLLRNTFLDPVITFFTDTVPDVAGEIAGYIGGFFSEIWEAWTGQGSNTRDVMGISVPTDAGAQGDSWLSRIFLDPVVRFFRDLPGRVADIASDIASFWSGIWEAMTGGPSEAELTASVISTAGGVGTAGGQYGPLQPLWDSLTNFKNNVRDLGLGEAFGEVWDGIAQSAGNIWAGADGNGGIKGALDDMWAEVTNWFSNLDWGAAISGAAIAGAIGLALAGLPGLVIGIIGGAIAADAGLIDPIINAIEAGWSQIWEALQGLWDNITTFFRNTFTVENLLSAGVDFLGFVNDVGTTIGEFFGSPAFQAAVGGALALGGAATVIVTSFTQGLITGLSGAFLDWAELIGGFINSAWDAVGPYLIFAPAPVIDAIGNMLGSETVGAAALVLGAVVGPKIVGAIIGGITTFGPRLVAGAGGLVAMVTGKKSLKQLGNEFARNSALKSVGTGIAAGVVAGIGAFTLGQAAGETGDVGGIILSLLAGGAGAAAIGFTVAGPIGAAVGGALGLAAAGVGAFFGNAERQARESREEVERLADALKGLSGGALAQAIEDELRAAVPTEGAFEDWGRLMVENFDFEGFAADLAAGFGEVDVEFVDLFTNISDQLTQQLVDADVAPDVAAEFVAQLTAEMAKAAESGEFTSFDDLFNEALSNVTLSPEAAAAMGDNVQNFLRNLAFGEGREITIGDLQNIFSAAEEAGRKIGETFGAIDTEEAVTGIDNVGEAIDEINSRLTGPGAQTAAQIAEILNQSELQTEERLQAVADVASDVADQLDDARQALIDFITGGEPVQTEQEILAQFTLDTAGTQREAERIAAELAEQTNTAIADASTTLNFSDFSDSLNEAVATAVEAGIITDPTSFEAFRQSLIDQVNATVTDPTLRADMLTAIEGLQVPTADLFSDLQVAQMTQAKIDEIADIVRSGVEEALGQVSEAELTASVITTAGGRGTAGAGLSLDLGGEDVGEQFSTEVAIGISNNASEIQTAVSTDLVGAGDDGMTTSAGAIRGTGAQYTQEVASGILGAASAVAGAAQIVAAIAVISASSYNSQMYSVGVNMMASMEAGIRDRAAGVATAAAAAAIRAIQAVQGVLGIASPSKVFRNIGRQIGQGFIRGIKDLEGDMETALGNALENAVVQARKRAGRAIERERVAAELFNLLTPSTIPGGTPRFQIQGQRLGLVQSLAEFLPGLRQGAAGALGEAGNVGLYGARVDLVAQRKAVRDHVLAMNEQWLEADRARDAIDLYNRRLVQTRKEYANGTLGVRAYKEMLADLKRDFQAGRIDGEAYKDRLEALNKELKSGVLNFEAYERALNELGDRPAGLTTEQLEILRTGTRTLAANTAAGLENRAAITEQIDVIRQWGQEALEAGGSVRGVVAQMKQYRNQLVNQLSALGFNRKAINDIIAAYGLSDAALKQLTQSLTNLNQATPGGAANASNILNQLLEIREFGLAMIESGVGAAAAVAQMKQFRNTLVQQAVAFGFNRAEVQKLVESMGLSDTQLATFIRELNAFNKAAADAVAVSNAATAAANAKTRAEERARKAEEEARKAEEAKRKAEEEKKEREEREKALNEAKLAVNRPTIETLIIQPPYGDPEAIALATFNRINYALPIGV